MNYKTCTKCRKNLPATNDYFYKNKNTEDGLRLHCKKCCSKINKQQYWLGREEELKQKEKCERLKTKICTKCRKEFPATDDYFFHAKEGKYGLRADCKKCAQEISKRWYEANKKQVLKYKKQWNKENPDYQKQWCTENKALVLLISTKTRSRKKKLDFNLTLDWVQKKLDRSICEVTGLEFKSDKCGLRRGPFTPSIDRIDSNKGYTKDNCQLVVWIYNQAKGEYDIETLYTFCKVFVECVQKKSLRAERLLMK